MPVIRITDETMEMLKHWAVPLEDTADDALRKVFAFVEEHRNCSEEIRPAVVTEKEVRVPPTRLRRGTKVPQVVYEVPILQTLAAMGGGGAMGEVLKDVETKVEGLLGEVDYERLPSGGDLRWRNTAAWARHELVKRGLLRNDSRWGIWELTDDGQKVAQEAGQL